MRVFAARKLRIWVLIALIAAVPAAGQYIVSTMAGYIHFAEGGVLLEEKPFEFDEAKIVHVGDGQRLRTVDGRAEVMILPGSFVRLAPASELEMIRGGLLAAEMKLRVGSAMIDLTGAMETEGIILLAGSARLEFLKPGLYRVDIPRRGGGPTLRVYHGKAAARIEGDNIEIGSKRLLTLAERDGELKPEKFKDSEEDDLARWNGERGTLLAVKAREEAKERGWRMSPLEESAIYRCRAMGMGCPSANRPPPPIPGARQPGGGGGGQRGGGSR